MERKGFCLLSTLWPSVTEKTSLEDLLLGDFIAAFQYIKEAFKKNGGRLFTRVCSDRTRGKDFKMKLSELRLDIMKKFFIMWEVRYWNMFTQRNCGDPITGII